MSHLPSHIVDWMFAECIAVTRLAILPFTGIIDGPCGSMTMRSAFFPASRLP